MASIKPKNKEVQLVNEGVELITENEVIEEVTEQVILVGEEIKEENVTLIEPVEEVVLPTKMVRIQPKVNHKCYIGGEWYYLIKDKQYNVPENVKSILMSADILSPL